MKTLLAIFALLISCCQAQADDAYGPLALLRAQDATAEIALPAVQPAPLTALPRLDTPAGWPELMNRLAAHGTFNTEPIMPNMGFVNIKGPLSSSHHSDYVNQWGTYANDTFYAEMATLVCEEWTLEGVELWRIHQWAFRMTLEGDLLDVQHVELLEGPGGEVISYRYLPMDDNLLQAKYNELVEEWLTFTGRH